jgi:hypothetical protein
LKISTVLDHIDSGHIALPEFQRGYVWNRDRVRRFLRSLYHRHPVGGLIVWATESKTAVARGDGVLAPGVVKLLLDGQQRMTTLYGIIQGKPPKFFDGDSRAFTGLRFHLEDEVFEFYQATRMKDDPLWIDVTQLMLNGMEGLGEILAEFSADQARSSKVSVYGARIARLLGIREIELHVEEVTGADKTLAVVVDIFNEVNSGGTKLTQGDLALAKICAQWPEGREEMKAKLNEWAAQGYNFTLDWLLRSVNSVLTGEARFLHLHDRSSVEIQGSLGKATRHIDTCLNLIAGRLGLDHDRVLFGRYGIPVLVRYIDQHRGSLTEIERDKLLFWFVQSGMWGRFSGSTESYIDQDLEALEKEGGGLDSLLEQLRLWHGGLRVEPGHFNSWSIGARFYPVLYLLTRMGEARDWGNGLPLKANLLGKHSKLHMHHIFPRSRLYDRHHTKVQVNAVANFCFLTGESNEDILNGFPEDYFPKVERMFPGALASQWIPEDPSLWKIDAYLDFLDVRRVLLAAEVNLRMEQLLHGDVQWLGGAAAVTDEEQIGSGISSPEEEAKLQELNDWVAGQGLSRGLLAYELTDPESGELKAILDLAWPGGLQAELSDPVAVMLNENTENVSLASGAGFKCFSNAESFRKYITAEVLAGVTP